jgi:hypothetical protein
MQIYSRYYFLHWSPFGFVVVVIIANERQLLYREATASLNIKALNVYQSWAAEAILAFDM